MAHTVRIEKETKLTFNDALDEEPVTVKLTPEGGLEFINAGYTFMCVNSDDASMFIHGLKMLKEMPNV